MPLPDRERQSEGDSAQVALNALSNERICPVHPLVAIVGPTATGKSRVAIEIALAFGGEIIGADSRQVYRYMDIGTAKPTPAQRSLVAHHLIDVVDPDDEFSLAQYRTGANRIIAEVVGRGKLPVLVGGSGLYVWTVLEGWDIPAVAPDADLRKRLERKAAEGGAAELYAELTKLDPAAAGRIDRRNIRRVIRALEVTLTTGKTFSGLQRRKPPPFRTLIIGLTTDRKELYRRVDERVDAMIAAGLVQEVKRLLDMGYSPDLPSMSGIGYRQIAAYLKGGLSLEEAVREIKNETHRFVRRQYAWFRLGDERIKWFDIQDASLSQRIRGVVGEFLASQPGPGAGH